MRTVYNAEHLTDAYLVKAMLEDIGIPAFVPGEYLVGAMGELPMLGLVAVSVPTGLWPEAYAALQRWTAEGMLGEVGGRGADEEPDAPGLVVA
jgi:hypothetical protein